MSQASGLTSEAASKPLSSHMLDSITPDSVTPQSGSPNSDTGYSPYSQPFAQRPTRLTSAGAAVRQSASSLPTPPPFTPGAESEPAGRVPPVAFADYSAGSCGSKGFMIDTPGVSSAWAGSSTKPAMQTESFAFNPPGASAASSPDVEQFNAATPNVNSQHPLPDLLGQAVHNMAASADTDTRSERSEAASQSSTTSRSSRRSIGQSPGDLLRQARVIFEKRVAVEGSSRIRHNRRNAFKTPMEKGAPPPAVTPQNTPMDVATEQHEDQSSPHKSHSTGGKASAPGTPGSVTGPDKASPATSPQSPEDQTLVTNTKALSPPDSNVSVVSIGSVCPTAGEVGRKLDFSSIQPEITAMPALLAEGVPDVAGVLEEPNSLRGPMPLHELIDSMQDTVTKQDCQELLGEFLNQPVLEFDIQRTSATSIDSPDLAREFMGPVQHPRRPRGWLSRAGTVLLWSLALLGICTAGMLAAEVLHNNMLSTPGVACTAENRAACLAARTAYFQEAGKDLNYPAALKMVKQLKWYMADLWDATFSKRFPEGVDTADILREYASRYSDDKLQAMTVSQARRIFGPLGAEFMPPIIAAKLAAAGDTAAVQQPPEDLIAVSAAQSAVPAKQQQFGSVAEPEPAVEQHMSSDITGAAEQLEAAFEAAAPEVAEEEAAVETATDAQEQPATVDVAAVEAPTVDAAAVESATAEPAVPEAAVTEVQEEVSAAEPTPSEEQPSAAADDSYHEQPAQQPVVEATAIPEQQQPEQLHQPLAFEEQQAPADAYFEQPEEHVQQQGAAPKSAADEPWTLAPAADSAATAAPAFEEQPAAAEEQPPAAEEQPPAAEEQPPAAEEPAAAAEEQETVAEPSQTDMQHHEVTKASGFWSYLPYAAAALAALLLPAAAYFASPLAQKVGPPGLDMAEVDGEVEGMDAYDHAAAAQEAAAEDAAAAEQEAAEAAAVDEAVRDDGGGGLLSDEEYEPPIRTPHRRHSAAALLDAAIAAGSSTLEAVRTSQVLRLTTYKPTSEEVIAGIADHQARVEVGGAAPAAAGLQEQLTPTAATRRTAATRTPRAAASGRTTSARSRSTAAAAAQDDGEEVQQPAPRSTGGRPRRTTRGRTSVLPEVPEDQPAADEPLLSDDEPAAAAAQFGRAGRRRQSAPAASADTETEKTSGRRRQRTIAAAATGADAVTTPRATRRSSRHSQG